MLKLSLITSSSRTAMVKAFETDMFLTSRQFFRLQLFQGQAAFHEFRAGLHRIYTADCLCKIEAIPSYLDFHGLSLRLLQCVNQIYVVHRAPF